MSEPVQAAAPAEVTRSPIERYTVLGVGVVLIAAMLVMIFAGTELSDDTRAILRVLLALMSATIGAFLPGALFEVEGKAWGLPIRAGGAAAFFVIVFWAMKPEAAPTVVAAPAAEPKLELTPLSIDLRSSRGFFEAGNEYRTASPAIVLPLGFAGYQPGRSVIIQNLRAELRFGDRILRFKPLHLTALTQNASDTGWLPNRGDLLYRIDLRTDRPVEIAFYAMSPGLDWQALLAELAVANLVTVQLSMDTNSGPVSSSCQIDFAPWHARLLDFAKRERRPVNRISMECPMGEGG